ncbi:MAG TPA: hypothetical protein VFS10_14630 [Pyrinomonadaceae bacterium]|nr:hypothetical protein [Pyrinomonadaceae bacterium]
MAETVPAEELAEVLGDIKEVVTVKGRERVITPLRVKQFVEVLKCVDKLADAGVVIIKPEGDLKDTLAQVRREFDAVKMILRGGDQLIRIVHIASGLSISEVEGLGLVDMTKLTSTVFKVNLDFFDRNAEAFTEALGPLGEAVKGLLGKPTEGGSEPSPASSTTATDLPM